MFNRDMANIKQTLKASYHSELKMTTNQSKLKYLYMGQTGQLIEYIMLSLGVVLVVLGNIKNKNKPNQLFSCPRVM